MCGQNAAVFIAHRVRSIHTMWTVAWMFFYYSYLHRNILHANTHTHTRMLTCYIVYVVRMMMARSVEVMLVCWLEWTVKFRVNFTLQERVRCVCVPLTDVRRQCLKLTRTTVMSSRCVCVCARVRVRLHTLNTNVKSTSERSQHNATHEILCVFRMRRIWWKYDRLKWMRYVLYCSTRYWLCVSYGWHRLLFVR